MDSKMFKFCAMHYTKKVLNKKKKIYEKHVLFRLISDAFNSKSHLWQIREMLFSEISAFEYGH
jgi:hypothetical protein